MRSSIVDLGSSTFHALVADVDELGIRNAILDRKVSVRIADDALALGRIPEPAAESALDAIGKLLARTASRVPGLPRVVATGVFCDAANGRELLARAAERHAIAIELLEPADEVRLVWRAVSAELAGSHGRLAVIEVGGWSLGAGAGSHAAELATALPLGVLRLRGLAPDAIRERIAGNAAGALGELVARRPDTVALSAGSARALLGLARKLRLTGDVQRHLARRTFGELARVLAPMSHRALAELGVSPTRAETIACSAAAIDAVLELCGSTVVYVARSGMREGALIEHARAASCNFAA
ncbi:MAG TPA: hypothetical protein VGF94_09570 [Kofleriaceae bacterium]|jgi:exopolyphosphatase/guanosine-5'-triphosphate,3'-diphosphate pyrophosphatase